MAKSRTKWRKKFANSLTRSRTMWSYAATLPGLNTGCGKYKLERGGKPRTIGETIRIAQRNSCGRGNRAQPSMPKFSWDV